MIFFTRITLKVTEAITCFKLYATTLVFYKIYGRKEVIFSFFYNCTINEFEHLFHSIALKAIKTIHIH